MFNLPNGVAAAGSQAGLMDPLQMAAFNNIARLPQEAAMAAPTNINFGGGGSGLGMNLDTAKLGLSGLATIAGILGGFKQLSLANKQFKYTKKVTDTNLENQTKAYNTTLSDRANARYYTQNMSQDQANAYLADNRLKDYKG